MRLAISAAVIAFAACILLGLRVCAAPPTPLDVAALGQYGFATGLAKVLTAAGRFPLYVVLCVATLAFGAFVRAWLSRALLAVVGLIVVWQTSDLCKELFHRARPPHPIVAESSFSYPSGHADLSIFFYGLWAYFIARSTAARPVRVGAVAFAALWAGAIGWSRIALGAHYPSDVAGGYLFGAGWLALAIAASHRLAGSRYEGSASRGNTVASLPNDGGNI